VSSFSTDFDHRGFALFVCEEPPAGYPVTEVPDQHRTKPGGTFESRRREYLDLCLRNPSPRSFKAPWYELPRCAAARPVHEGILRAACAFIDARRDCSDFILHALLRQRFQFPDVALSAELDGRIRQSILGFKYWPDEPGTDSLCTWTENHQILYASAGFLAGVLYPGETFTSSGRTGAELAGLHAPRIRRWLDLRFRTGFSEWLSNVYYDEDLAALLSLLDFSPDPDISRRAGAVIDLILLDMALHGFQGVCASTHGRSYDEHRKRSSREAVSDTMKLVYGAGCYARVDNMSAVAFALSPVFRLSPALEALARDGDRPEVLVRQRMGIRVAEAGRWGLGFRSLEDGMVLLSLEAYLHPRTARLTFRMFDAFRWWQNEYFAPFAKQRNLVSLLRRSGLMRPAARLLQKDLCRNTREEVNLITFRTPDYQLSSAVDYRKGFGGDQQAIWQATLGPGAVCFVTHPAGSGAHSPDMWTGEGTLPRVGQHRNVLVSVYRIDTRPGLYRTNRLLYTHAWLPVEAFDEVVARGHWVFARKGAGYLALWARNGLERRDPGELVSRGTRNIWLCELGRARTHGTFTDFCRSVENAPLRARGSSVLYRSPSVGLVRFGWRGPLRVNDTAIPLRGFPRYDSPYVRADFDPAEIVVEHAGHRLVLDRWAGRAEEA
jgi:hypothetical protein